MFEFPRDFFWGAATSAYQVEGGNIYSDWWDWEIKAGLSDRSGQACRQYELYRQDFDMSRQLNHNAHRFSVEWGRIEKEEGVFDGRELEHYRDVVAALRERGMEPVITLHHFTNPVWFARKGGWLNRDSIKYFLRYVEKAVQALCGAARFWVTINEPMVYAYHAFFLGAWPPQERSVFKASRAADALARAHIEAYRLIHKIYHDNGLASPQVSIAHNVQAFVPYDNSPRTRTAAYLRDHWNNFAILDRLTRCKSLDFIGINYYTRSLVKPLGWSTRNMLIDCAVSNLKKNSLGWEIYPEGLHELLIRINRYKLPVFILENGICTDNDDLRWEYILGHLEYAAKAIKDGVRLLGYMYWSLIDNFEWDKGFAPRFGLIEVDYRGQSRRIRRSAELFSKVCSTGRLE